MLGGMFRALRIRNYRLYFCGQLASMAGTWMQLVGLAWLVLKLTGSGTDVGVATAAQFVPVLLLGGWAGVVADRFDNRTAVTAVQVFLGVQAAVLAAVVLAGVVEMWMVYVLAVMQGVGTAFDAPTCQSFLGELVGDAELTNAVALNGVLFQMARIVGPVLAGLLIDNVSIGACFAVNAASYVVVIAFLTAMDPAQLLPRPRVARAAGQLREGIKYVLETPRLRALLAVTAVAGTFALQFNVVLPVFAKFTLHGNAGTLATMLALHAAGGLVVALLLAAGGRPTSARILLAVVVLGASMLATATTSTLGWASAGLFVVGGATLAVLVQCNTSVQLVARPELRGRAIALYFLVSQGSNVVGGPIAGLMAQELGARAAIAFGGGAALVAAVGWLAHARGRLHERMHVATA